jgi:hypothetical protein
MAAKIFISYRRDDSGPYAARMCDLVNAMLGHDVCFFDIDTINPGRDYRNVIANALSSCKVMLVVIGKQWATMRNDSGRLRLNSKTDLVHIEIASGLQKGLAVIPTLVGGARMPAQSSLPLDLRPLGYHNAWILSDRHFRRDVELLVGELKKILPETPLSLSLPSLFPLYGITLGLTPESELAGIARREDAKEYHYYLWNEVKFFASRGILNMLHFTRDLSSFPPPWDLLGFRWDKSYNLWLSFIKDLGYTIIVVQNPRVGRWQDHDSFQARVIARKDAPCPQMLFLDFRYSKETTIEAPYTLYSLTVRAGKDLDIDGSVRYQRQMTDNNL